MAMIEINGTTVNVDVRAEIEAFEWSQPKWSDTKLIAASPFRQEHTPSFFVRLEPCGEYEAGIWGDSGAFNPEHKSGNLVRLLAFLRNETEEEAAEYLLEKYGTGEGQAARLIVPVLRLRKPAVTLSDDLIEVLPSPYLLQRGITAEVQKAAGIGRSSHKGYTAIPWKTFNGRIANIKYRATVGKHFFYEKGATPIQQLVYGIDTITKREPVIICEAEIDALSWRVAGFQAVALGGVVFTDCQADLIRRTPATCYVICGDNDAAGRFFNEKVKKKLVGERVKVIDYATDFYKDANEILQAEGTNYLYRLFECAKNYSNSFAMI